MGARGGRIELGSLRHGKEERSRYQPGETTIQSTAKSSSEWVLFERQRALVRTASLQQCSKQRKAKVQIESRVLCPQYRRESPSDSRYQRWSRWGVRLSNTDPPLRRRQLQQDQPPLLLQARPLHKL